MLLQTGNPWQSERFLGVCPKMFADFGEQKCPNFCAMKNQPIRKLWHAIPEAGLCLLQAVLRLFQLSSLSHWRSNELRFHWILSKLAIATARNVNVNGRIADQSFGRIGYLHAWSIYSLAQLIFSGKVESWHYQYLWNRPPNLTFWQPLVTGFPSQYELLQGPSRILSLGAAAWKA